MSVLWSNETLIDKRRQKPFRVFAPSPSWLEEENQILTPREWRPRRTVGNKEAFWALTGIVIAAVVGAVLVRAMFSLR